MKHQSITYLSLAVSITALACSAWVYLHAEEMAAEALRKREAELVTHYAPKVRQVYLDMTGKTNALPQNPKTLEELLSPLVWMVEQEGDIHDDTKKAEPPK